MLRHLLTLTGGVAAILVSAAIDAAPARADANAPVCAQLYSQGGAIVQCDFFNYSQCQATISGRGGSCYDNPSLRESQNRMPRTRSGF